MADERHELGDVGPVGDAAASTLPTLLVDREERDPWLRWLLHLGLPVLVSIGVHLAVLAGLAVMTWQVLAAKSDTVEYEAGITTADFAGGAFKWPGEALPEPETAADVSAIDDWTFRADTGDIGDIDLDAFDAAAKSLDEGGFGIGASGRSGVLGIGGGAGDGGGGGMGSGFGASSGIGRAGVWGLTVPGRSFAYVVDFSGSIIVAVDDLKRELKRSVGALTGSQSFNVFLFYSTGLRTGERFVTESFAPKLQPGQPDVKREFFDWLDGKAPTGSTQPLAALKRALAFKPDAIFFFSDGYFEDDVVDQALAANKNVKAQIHCLVFDELLLQDTSGLPRTTDGVRRLQRLAESTGGACRVITGRDLQRN